LEWVEFLADAGSLRVLRGPGSSQRLPAEALDIPAGHFHCLAQSRVRLQGRSQELRGRHGQLISAEFGLIESPRELQARAAAVRLYRLEHAPGSLLDDRVKKTRTLAHELEPFLKVTVAEPEDVHEAARTLAVSGT